MELTAIRPRLSENDRLGVTAFGSLLAHMVIILGVTFVVPKLQDVGAQTLEITLVQARGNRTPAHAEYLAQFAQDGGGDSERPHIATNPLPLDEVSDTHRNIQVARAPEQQAVTSKRDQRELMTRLDADKKIYAPPPEPQRKDERIDPAKLGVRAPTYQEEKARLIAEIDRSWQEYQQRPKIKYLNTRTKEYKDALYLASWQAKVERVGNLNYPEEAKRRGLRGRVRLTVVVQHDGMVREVIVNSSSGHKLIDDAARRIAELAAPYSVFPPDLRAEADLLYITRTWKFNDSFISSD
jgi:periplasmic protein TonB